MPARQNGKIPKYPHKNGAWDKNKAENALHECSEEGAVILLDEAIIVVDVDEEEWVHTIEADFPEFQRTVQTQTKKGKHYYFTRTDRCHNIYDGARLLVDLNNKPLPIDIKTQTRKGTRGVISIPPSPHKKWLITLGVQDPAPLPDSFVDFINLTKKVWAPRTPSIVSEALSISTLPFSSISQYTGAPEQPQDDSDDSGSAADIVPHLINLLASERACTYTTWIEVGWALHNTDPSEEYFVLWDKFSQQCPEKYDANECRMQWCEMQHLQQGGLSKGSLHYWAKQDNPDTYHRAIAALNNTYGVTIVDIIESDYKYNYNYVKEVFEKSVMKIRQPLGFIDMLGDEMNIKTKSELMITYEELKYYEKDQPHSFLKRWVDDGHKLAYDRIDFLPPPMTLPPRVFNTWRGFVFDVPGPGAAVASSKNVDPFIFHISLMAGHDETTTDYLIKWFAQLIQEPGKLNGIAPVIISRQGAGKNIFFNKFAQHILGKQYYFETSKPDDELAGRFSNGRLNKLLIDVDEANSKSTFQIAEQIKNMITSDYFNYEAKGVKQIQLRNFARIIFTTNNIVSVKIPIDDRRHIICEMSPEKCGDRNYFDGFDSYMSEVGNQKAIVEYLCGIDISKVNWVNDRPLSHTYRISQYCCQCTVLKYIEYLYQDVNIDDGYTVSGSDLFKNYIEWAKDNNYMDKRGSSIVMELFKEYGMKTGGIVKKKTKLSRMYVFSRDGIQTLLEINGIMML